MFSFLTFVGVTYLIFKDAKDRKAVSTFIGQIKRKYF